MSYKSSVGTSYDAAAADYGFVGYDDIDGDLVEEPFEEPLEPQVQSQSQPQPDFSTTQSVEPQAHEGQGTTRTKFLVVLHR